MPGGMNQAAMMTQAQKMQQERLRMQQEQEAKTFTAASGGGMVSATVNGKHELVNIEIKPEAVDPDDVEMLQDMVIAAVNEAMRAADAEAANNMSRLTGGLNLGGLFYGGAMHFFPAALQNLADQFARLPGIGGKTAQRLAFHVLSLPLEEAEEFAAAILEAKKSVHTCPCCQNLTDRELCPICDDETRDRSTICVVAEPRDVIAMERSREFRGLYHVLHGVISPLNHVTQDDIKIKELLTRVAGGEVKEVIMATNPDTEGEATAMYISRLLRPMEVKVTRLAYGVPVGSQLEYADEVTLSRALEGRQEM